MLLSSQKIILNNIKRIVINLTSSLRSSSQFYAENDNSATVTGFFDAVTP